MHVIKYFSLSKDLKIHENRMCFTLLIKEVQTIIEVHVVTTTGHCALRKLPCISRSKLGRL